ncbi:MAG: NifB/NifX family molybdenum-iron cluster-binding protein [Patescibacteria group bacterium]|jgi:predicted Fe-Mo cluster-binding NifX family protein|nr:NifB/NifX family molybdenum-iron cluster-binding protein [Patescibacteria group bacterium]
MRVAIALNSKDLAKEISEVFARSPLFAIIEIKDGEIVKTEIIENQVASQLGQAGIAAAQLVTETGASVVITNNIGPRALDVLSQFKIKVYSGKGSAEDLLNDFNKGKLKEVK